MLQIPDILVTFKRGFIHDVALALRLADSSSVVITRVSAGSILVEFRITAASRDLLDGLLTEFTAQYSNASSVLRTANTTSHLDTSEALLTQRVYLCNDGTYLVTCPHDNSTAQGIYFCNRTDIFTF